MSSDRKTSLEDAILRLSEVSQLAQLEEALCEAVQMVLPRTEEVVAYLADAGGHAGGHGGTQDLLSSRGLLHKLPHDGVTGEAIAQQKRHVVNDLDPADPLSGLLGGRSFGMNRPHSRHSHKGLLCCGTMWKKTRKYERNYVVCCSPVIDKETDSLQAVIVALCDSLSTEDHRHLDFVEKQFLVCYRRLKHTCNTHSNGPTSIFHKERSVSSHQMLRLCAELYDQDAASLQVKVIHFLLGQTQAETGFIFIVDKDRGELFCQAIGDKILEEEVRMPIERCPLNKVINTKSPVSLDDLQKSEQAELEEHLSLSFRCLLAVPVCSKTEGNVIAIACIANKLHNETFNESDEDVIHLCFKYTATVLHSTLSVQNERKLKNQTQALLQIAKNLFTHLDDLTKLLREIMQEARNLTKAERCSVFLLERETNELVAKVFDGDVRSGKEVRMFDENELEREVRIPIGQGVAGQVAITGQLLNIDDAYSHPLFYRGVDDTTGFKTRNILCFPLKDEKDDVIGVAQLCNKLNGVSFSTFDEEVAKAFSVYCCISIVHSLLYQKVRDAQHRSKLSNELMNYHMMVSNEEVFHLFSMPVPRPTEMHPDMASFSFTPRSIPYDQTALAVLSMFEDMGLTARFRINKDVLSRFALMVRKGYREPPYHNWAHAFAVAHFCYLMFKNTQLLNYLDEIELFALFAACLCHDIDHRGTTNSFQVASGSVLAALYCSEGSVMERHHFAQSMCILNTEGCNIFIDLPRKEYEKALDLMRDIILATDLSHHLRIMKDLETMAEEGYDKKNPRHRSLLLFLLMTSCDLSDQTKNWTNSKKIAELIYQEFFSQGDLEKATGRDVQEMMDRDRACIPLLQIDFLNKIALPVFRLLAKIFPDASEVLQAVLSNRDKWECLNTKLLEMNAPRDMTMFDMDLKEEDFDPSQ